MEGMCRERVGENTRCGGCGESLEKFMGMFIDQPKVGGVAWADGIVWRGEMFLVFSLLGRSPQLRPPGPILPSPVTCVPWHFM